MPTDVPILHTSSGSGDNVRGAWVHTHTHVYTHTPAVLLQFVAERACGSVASESILSASVPEHDSITCVQPDVSCMCIRIHTRVHGSGWLLAVKVAVARQKEKDRKRAGRAGAVQEQDGTNETIQEGEGQARGAKERKRRRSSSRDAEDGEFGQA